MRTRARVTLCLAALLLAGCDMPTFPGITCIPFEPGDCGTPVGTYDPPDLMIGFPESKLDTSASATGRGARGLLRVGDSVTFYVVSGLNFPNDTVRNVSWAADTTTAHVLVRSDGGMTLVATALGAVVIYTGDIVASWVACQTTAEVLTCTTINEIDVVP
jgi:hypothetical protein